MRTPTVSQRLRHQFLGRIRGGQWRTGQAIPTEMALAAEFGVSRTAVRRALKGLETSGLLVAVQGSGRRVTTRGGRWSATIGLLARGGEFGLGQGGRFLRCFDNQAARRGHSLLLYAVRPEQADAGITLSQPGLQLNHLDAAILYSSQYRLADIEQLARRIPVVSTPNDATAASVPSFILDYGMHASMAVEALAAQGHRRIALLLSADPRRSLVNAAARRGFDLGRLHAGLPLDDCLVLTYPRGSGASVFNPLYDACRRLDPPVTAVVARVVTPLYEMAERGRQTRDRWFRRLSLVCLADMSEGDVAIAGLADFRCDIEHMVSDAVACLDGMLRGEAPTALSHLYYGTLRPGQTLRPAP